MHLTLRRHISPQPCLSPLIRCLSSSPPTLKQVNKSSKVWQRSTTSGSNRFAPSTTFCFKPGRLRAGRGNVSIRCNMPTQSIDCLKTLSNEICARLHGTSDQRVGLRRDDGLSASWCVRWHSGSGSCRFCPSGPAIGPGPGNPASSHQTPSHEKGVAGSEQREGPGAVPRGRIHGR